MATSTDKSKHDPLNFSKGEPGPLEDKRPVSPAPSDVSMKSDRSKHDPLNFSKGEPGPLEDERPVSPAPSDVSMKSDRSKHDPLNFSKGEPGPLEDKRPVSPTPSDVSMKSDRSKHDPLNFSKGEPGPLEDERPVSPAPSDVSMKSDRSKHDPLNFSKGEPGPLEDKRPVSPTPSDVSMKSDRSKHDPLNFSKGEPGPLEDERPVSPAPSDVSMKSDRSKHDPLNFSKGEPGPLEDKRPVSPAPSDVSMKSDRSKHDPLNFSKGEPGPLEDERPVSPAPSDVSMKSDRSKHDPLNFSKGEPGPLEDKRPVSPAPSDVSMKSDRSKHDPLNFSKGEPGPLEDERPVSPAPSDVSVKSDRSKHDPLNFSKGELGPLEDKRPVSPAPSDVSMKSDRSKHDPLNFSKGEPGPLEDERPVSPAPSDVSMKSDRSKHDPLNFSEGEPGPPEEDIPVSLAPSNVVQHVPQDDPLNFLSEISPPESQRPVSTVTSRASMETDQLDEPGSSEGSETLKRQQKLISALKKRFLSETTQDEDKNHPNWKNTEHIMREDRSIEVNDEEKNGRTVQEKSVTQVNAVSDIFKDTNEQTIRTVLTTGKAGIGKSFHVQKFIKEWAKNDNKRSGLTWFTHTLRGKAKVDEEVIFPLNFSKLNFRKEEKVSLMGLLNHFFKEMDEFVISDFEQFKVLFVLDGLDAYQLPLDNNTILTDVREPASVDVLLTNLIKGNLLPSARLWITSRPAAANQLCDFVMSCGARMTEIRYKNVKHELTADLKTRILRQHEEELERHETDTELYEIDTVENKKYAPQTYDDLFHSTKKGKQVRTVLMKGVAGVGKTFQTRRFMVDWAKGKSNKNIDFIVPFHFSELNSRRDEVQSMKDLLHHSLNDNEHRRPCNYKKCKVAFVLDGLEKCELPLDFKNNKKLTDMEEAASMDVLLTNLIKGKLLPSALLWIISQPSGVDKIPTEYIKKVTECQDKDFKDELTADLKTRILRQHEEDLQRHETDTELYVIGTVKNKKYGPQTYDELFHSTKKGQEVRTVLMKGVAGVGKTFQTRRFMVDWAKGKSNKNIDLIVPFHFSELNSRRDEVQSMKDLLHHSLNDNEHRRPCNYEKCNVAFVLDGLEKCELPLDFKNNKKLTDMEEAASMDVLLTNLIEGNLLPSALLWIISQPSGVDKIPTEYIEKVTECQDKDFKDELTADLKTRILRQHEEDLQRHETDTELYEIDTVENKKYGPQTYDKLFHSTKKGQEVRTVRMKGVAGVGKTFQTSRFMVDWAKGKSNKNIDLIVPFNFNELNSKRDEVQSMKDLLRISLNDNEHRRPCNYEKCKVAFVLDGLEKCELPLDFKNNKKLTDMEEAASMDVLLTNLIEGKLLPSALLWIISQPSGVDKIPTEYIEKVTECRETLKRRQKLISALKKRFLSETTQDEDKNHPNWKNTEHIMREDRSIEVNDEEKNGRTVQEKSVTQVNAVSDIFKDTNEQKIRTVLTTGEAGIGKSFHVQKFIKEWAKNDNKRSVLTWLTDTVWGKAKVNEEVIFPLNFSKLNFRKEEKVSLMGLLNHFFKEMDEFVISDFEQFKVLFVLDGLDAYQLPLDNNTMLTDVREPASVDVLLTNLIKGNLLPSAQLWITSRPAAANQLCDFVMSCGARMTEIRCKPDVASQQKLKSQLKEQFTHVSEGIDRQKVSALLNEIYTDLYIIEGERGEVNDQHETRQVQNAKFTPVTQETLIKYHDIFKPASEKPKPIRTVLTIGVAGVGKTFATMKYMLDWAEDTANSDIFYMLPLSFRELNLRKGEEHSLEELINCFCPAMETSEIKDYNKYRILIVLDGLDECRLKLDFNNINWTDVRKPTSVDVLLTNLIQGNLLSEAQVWITSRPAAYNDIPADKVDRVTEVRGFNDEQKEEYFRKRFCDKDLAEKILSHVKKSRSLYIMCHIPVFCWITGKVLEDFVNRNQEERMPKTLTDMYIYFLLLQCRQANVKYGGDETGEKTDSCWNTRNTETILSLGKLAFKGLEEGNFLFTEGNLTECGVDFTKAAVFSGLFTQVKRESRVQDQQKFFSFVHLSIQEFLAVFYVFHTFNNKGENLLTMPGSTVKDLSASDFYKTAVDKALDAKNGDWDLVLRFLLGLSLETNQNLLQELLKQNENNKETNKETIGYIKEKIRDESSDAEKKINLFYCLNELNDHSLVEEVKKYLHSDTLTFENFSASQWSALTFVLLTSDEKLDVFDLKKYQKSEKVLLGMLPVVKVSKTALLSWCELSEESCKGLSSSVLDYACSNLTELDLSHNDLLDSGVEILAEGLKSIHCKVEILKLSGCQVTEKGCSFLASALEKTSSLKHLDLSYNHPGANGVAMLSAIAADSNMSLTTLCLDHGGVHRLKPGLKKYGADLKLDENTASRRLVLSEGNRRVKTVKKEEEKVSQPENKDRFKRSQVLCEEGLKGLCYFEVEWKGRVGISMAYEGVGRKWDSEGGLGCNEVSWSLLCEKYTAIHGETSEHSQEPPCPKIAVFLDWEGGSLTYYNVTSGQLSLIHTFHAKFTEPLFPGFWLENGSVTLCEIDSPLCDGKLAFKGLEEGNLTECGVDFTKAAVFSGLFPEITRESRVQDQQKFFYFVHLSIQEFLAVFYAFHTFNNKGENLLTMPGSTVEDLSASDFSKTAVDKALDAKDGDWDLVLRLLLGLSLETNQNLLQELLEQNENNKETNKETIGYIKEKIREESSDAEKKINLFYCLNELNDHSLVKEVKKYLHSDTLTFENFSASQWSALTFALLTSDERLDVFDLKKYQKSEKVLLGMLLVVKVSKTALLSWCELSEESCKGLSSSVLDYACSNLTELDLSHNDLLDSGVEILAEGLKSRHCKVEILKLSGCQVTEKGCSFLASALEKTSSLKHLDLSYNHPGANGVAMLSAIAEDPNMSLKTLCLDHGGVHRLKPGLKKYGADLKLDENTASRRLVLSEGNRRVKTVKKEEEKVSQPENKDRFKRSQVLCEEGLKGLCYFEVEWKGRVGISMAYEGVGRKWDSEGGLGCNEVSWSLLCEKYTAIHGETSEHSQEPPCPKIAVFLDWEGGSLTYYNVTSGQLSLIHTFHAKFTEPLFPGFWLENGSVTLCEIDSPLCDGKLAFKGLEEGNLTECGVDFTKAAVFSGLFPEITRESRVQDQQKFFYFVHLSIQEFLAVFYAFHTFNNKGENLLTMPGSTVEDLSASDFSKTAVDKALDAKDGDWDLVLRLLLGLSLETNQNLLQELLEQNENNKETNKETIGYIKEKIREESSDAEKKINLFYCLNELKDHPLVKEVKKYLHSDTLTFENFSASQWSALTFALLTSDERLDVFDLKKYQKSEKVLLGMLLVVKVSKTALLSWCELSEESCKGLSSSVLDYACSNLTELDLSHNDLLDSGVEILAEGLKSRHCKVEILKLSGCQVTEKGCSFLASALEKTSSLKHLDLSYNHPGANGVAMLSAIAADSNMSLTTLCLDHGGVHRLKPGLKKYGADLKLDENTASRRLVLSEGNRKVKTVKKVEEKVSRPENKDRFKRSQVLCEEGLKGLCYFEVEWKGRVGISMAYEGVGRKWDSEGGLGCNEVSWSLLCKKTGYTAIHGETSEHSQEPPCPKIAVFLDWEGGSLTYYNVTSGQLSLIHTFHAKFTEPLFPGFWFQNGSVTLCEID